MHLCTGQHTNIVELRALCQHEAALYMVMVRSSAAQTWPHMSVNIHAEAVMTALAKPA